MCAPDSEESLNKRTLNLFVELGWHKDTSPARKDKTQVVLESPLRQALQRLNPDCPTEAIEQGIETLTRSRATLSLVNANHEIYQLLKEGIRVNLPDDDIITLRVIDWQQINNNDFLITPEFTVMGENTACRADLIGFVNGLPWVFIELKAHHNRIETAYRDNLKRYKRDIPLLLHYNALVILSNGSQAKLGTLTTPWEHFTDWKKINDEGEQGKIDVETLIRGTCTPIKLLDLVENFTLFAKGGSTKLIAKNHQYLGVNKAIQAVVHRQSNQGHLGVFWHTQGSGKSYAMIFLAQKVLRKLSGNWTFVIITDRDDLDTQIYKNFSDCSAVTEQYTQAQNSEHLKQLLRENHRYLFTLIQKFRTSKGEHYPVLSERNDIIVIADEAHRSQYDVFAANLRQALPHAAFIGFTGTPLMAGEEKTREVFGDYISIYNFHQSIADGATVPLYYENRVPAVQLTHEHLNLAFEHLINEAELDEQAELKVQQQFAREYQVITRDERLDIIAQDIVAHFISRGYLGKAMVISIDKLTAVKMYHKVQVYWQRKIETLKKELMQTNHPPYKHKAILDLVRYMTETDMVVVISPSANEIEIFNKRGFDIRPHRERMNKEDLKTRFGDKPDDPLRIVFVCAMWLTGFDVPSCSTLYLDKPLRNHNLMQAIARANRVFRDKVNGLIVDYIGIFNDLQNALAIYASSDQIDLPIKDKAALVLQLNEALTEIKASCLKLGLDLTRLHGTLLTTLDSYQRTRYYDEALDKLLVKETDKKNFLTQARLIKRLFKAILPDNHAQHLTSIITVIDVLHKKINSLLPQPDIEDIMIQVERLLDNNVTARLTPITPIDPIDINQIDFEAIHTTPHLKVEHIKKTIQKQITALIQRNPSRINYQHAYQRLLDDYNAHCHDAMAINQLFDELKKLSQALTQEEQRHVTEQLTEEELTLFDLLLQPDIPLDNTERQQVKELARVLLDRLKQEKLVLDWHKRQQARAAVKITIEETLDQLPQQYDDTSYHQICETVYQHIYDHYRGEYRI